MNCSSYCIASSFILKKILQRFQPSYQTSLFREVLHLIIPLNGDEETEHTQEGHVFIFSYGVAVFWNLSEEKQSSFLQKIKQDAIEPLTNPASEHFSYKLGDRPEIEQDCITLANDDPLSKLALSHGMAQSTKLEVFEHQIEGSFLSTQHIPEELARFGKTHLKRGEVRKKMGELFLTRNSITLHLDVLDLPDFFWDYPDLEPLYDMIAHDLDLKNRVEVLVRRLDSVKELFEMLSEEMNHQHSSRLELTIIILIVIEVVINVIDLLHVL